MLESLIGVKHEAKDHLNSVKKRDYIKNLEDLETLNDVGFWEQLEKLLIILRPLSQCIATAERAEGA